MVFCLPSQCILPLVFSTGAKLEKISHRIPASILTGFLGSGKTTLLCEMLAHPLMRRTVVLVNEFGDIGIDDLLLKQIAPTVVLLESGCICCTIGDDLVSSLLQLLGQREEGIIPEFDRVVVETTGLADPVPVLQGFMGQTLRATPFRLAGVITTVDALNGARQFDTHTESVKQVAVADRLVVTKSDLVTNEVMQSLVERLRQINPTALVYPVINGHIEPEKLLDAGLWNPRSQRIDIPRWLNDVALPFRSALVNKATRHDDGIDTFCLAWQFPVSYPEFADCLEGLLAAHGERLLRVKGILDVEGATGPAVVHGVQKMFYPPVHLPQWPTDERGSRLVFITQNFSRKIIEDYMSEITRAPITRQ